MTLSELEHYEETRDGWLLDTNVISATLGNKPLADGISYFFNAVSDARLRISVVTIGEMRKGIQLLSESRGQESEARRTALRASLNLKLHQLQERWTDRIITIDLAVADRWGIILGEHQRTGDNLPAIDAMIAATAYVHNLVVVSRDGIFDRIHEVVNIDPSSISSA